MKTALTLLLAAFAQDPAPESEPPPALVVVPRVTAFFADIDGRVRADEASFPSPIIDGSSVAFDSDLDLDDSDPVWILEIAAFHRGGGRYLEQASVTWLDATYEGTSTFDSAETFNARVFPAGTSVDSKVRYRSLGADFTVMEGDPWETGNTVGSVLMGVRYTDLRIRLEGGGQDTDERLRLLWLGVGLRGETHWGDHLRGVLQGAVYFTFGEFDNWVDLQFEAWGGALFEGSAGLQGSIGPLQLEAGWRLISNSSYSEIDETDKFEDNDFSFLLSGPYASATLRF